MSLKQKTIHGLFWSFIDSFVVQAVTFIVGIIMARLLSPKEFGLIGMITIFITISSTFINSGFSQALIRKQDCTSEDYSTVFYFNFATSLFFFIILFFTAPMISSFFNEPKLILLIQVLSLGLVVDSISTIQRVRLNKEINFKLQTRISLISSLISGIIGIWMAYSGFGVWSLVIRTLSSQIISTGLLWMWLKWRPILYFSKNSFNELFTFGYKLLISALINTTSTNLFLFIIGKYFSATELGYFTRADMFKSLPSQQISNVISRVSYPVLASIQTDPIQLKAGYKKLITSTMLISFVLMMGMAAIAEPMVITLIGENWRPSIIYLQLLCFVGMFYPLHALNLNMLQVLGRSDLFLKLEIIKMFLAIPTIVIGILFGIKIMIFGMIVNSLIAYFLNSYWSGKFINYSSLQQIKDILPSFLFSAPIALLVFFVGYFIGTSYIQKLMIQIVLGAGLFIGVAEMLHMDNYIYIREIVIDKVLKKKIITMPGKTDKPIFVTSPYLPPLEEFQEYLKDIWESRNLTNNGPFHQELEQKLCEYLGVKHISLFSNGTLALVIALQALKITGEVITTPYSFVATAHALLWNSIKPIFIDIEPNTFNIDPEKIERSITPQTSAILPVHVYGHPCNTKRIHEIAEKHGLKVIYDAAHAFGVKISGTSVANFGDLSVLSFHATKVFNTFEGGAIICHDENTKKNIDQLKNFGIVDEITVVTQGINAKMNEFQAALGILQLKYIDEMVIKRKKISETYREAFREISGISFFLDQPDIKHNYGYFPILIDANRFGKTRDEVFEEFRINNIFGRRYFYPLINQFPMYCNLESSLPGKMPVAERITKEVLCLPIYPDLEISTVNFICGIIKKLSK